MIEGVQTLRGGSPDIFLKLKWEGAESPPLFQSYRLTQPGASSNKEVPWGGSREGQYVQREGDTQRTLGKDPQLTNCLNMSDIHSL